MYLYMYLLIFKTKKLMEYGTSSKIVLLHSGPSLTTNLFYILMRFGTDIVAIVADIEKTFLQIALNSQLRDLVRSKPNSQK